MLYLKEKETHANICFYISEIKTTLFQMKKERETQTHKKRIVLSAGFTSQMPTTAVARSV